MFDGFLGPKHPAADPFTLIIEHPAKGPVRAVGYVPSQDMLDALNTLMKDRSGSAELTLASGAIADTWGADVMATIASLGGLDDWRLVISGNRAQLSGVTTDSASHDRLTAAFADGLPGRIRGQGCV